MWLFFLGAWFVLLAAIAFLVQQAFGYDISHLSAWFAGLPMPQRIATGTILTAALALIGASAGACRARTGASTPCATASGRPVRTSSSPMPCKTTSTPPSST
ncbi:hypothetical protein [Bradyrhizobium sp. SEMIA]|uniref:hypothetical protein n=1 Tax=Bradyrhizobium sp. SEMIA TaxID=2597515 RepID=UPI0022408D35|nr:hypothetical protein [Bradyrhizobium sp. SEMIA]